MDWRKRIHKAYELRESRGYASAPKFCPPASGATLHELQSSLGMVLLPLELKGLLRETDGVIDLMEVDGEWVETGWLFWSAEEIAKQNLWYRSGSAGETYGLSFDDLLFFTGAGLDEILFAFALSSGRGKGPEIYVWHPRENTVEEVAPSLEAFVEAWTSEKVPL